MAELPPAAPGRRFRPPQFPLHRVRNEADLDDLRGRHAPAYDGTGFVLDFGLALDAQSGRPLVAVVPMRSLDPRTLGRMFRRIRWGESAPRPGHTASGESRLSGISASNSTFGFLPPVPLRRRFGCSRCAFDTQHPNIVELLYHHVVPEAHLAYMAALGDDFYSHVDACDAIPPSWRLGGSLWTSGVINNNTALPYHRDSSNVVNVWSALLVLRRHCEGGWLHIPSHDIWIPAADGTFILFDGQRRLHGVSPFHLSHPSGYRYSLVLYSRAGMRECSPAPDREALRAAARATAAALRRAGLQAPDPGPDDDPPDSEPEPEPEPEPDVPGYASLLADTIRRSGRSTAGIVSDVAALATVFGHLTTVTRSTGDAVETLSGPTPGEVSWTEIIDAEG